MTNRERLLTIMAGQVPDRIPWIPRLLIWHTAHTRLGTLPERFAKRSLRDIERSLGMGTPARDGRIMVSEQTGDVETTTAQEGASTLTTYRTPAGAVSTRSQSSEELAAVGIQGLEVEHMIKGPEDYAAVEYLVEHTHYRPTPEEFVKYDEEIGDDGYPLVGAGDCPFHHFLQKLAGYETGYYHLADYPDLVQHLLTTMEEVERERQWPLVAATPARLILHGLHLDSSMTPPPVFEQYITPYYQDFSELLHSRAKTLCMHADNDSRLILNHIRDAGFDMVETFTTDPLVSCTLEEARQVWQDDVIIWGGVPSVILESTYSEEAFERYMARIFCAVAPGKAFILGVADNVMPDALPGRLERIGEMVEEWGDYPVDPDRISPQREAA